MTGDEITDMLKADELQARVDMDWLRELANNREAVAVGAARRREHVLGAVRAGQTADRAEH